MPLSVTNSGGNPQAPSIIAEAFIPDQLIAGELKLVSRSVSISAGTLKRGTIMGQKTIGTATSAVKASGANTGTGTCVMDATTPVLANAKVGVYTVRNIEAVTNGGKFIVTDPLGNQVGAPIIVAGAGGTITFSNEVKFVLTDAGTDFIVGDGFDITVAAGDLTYIKSVKTAVDGSQYPVAVLADDADASGGTVVGGIYLHGEFNQNAVIYDSSWGGSLALAMAAIRPYLDPRGIFLHSFVSAADPT